MDTIDIWGYKLIIKDLGFIPLHSKVVINTMSPNSYGLATKDKRNEKALKNADFLVLDGLYFGIAPLIQKGIKVKRITGWDCFQYFSNIMNNANGSVFFLGSSNDTLEKIVEKYSHDFPNVKTAYYSPPFKSEFSQEDNLIIYNKINTFRPDVLFIGLTAPKQERWGVENKEFIDVHIINAIGNVFDWYAGNSVRPGVFWQKIGLEWLVRIFYRPEILKRNIANQMIFFWHLFLILLKIKKV